MSAPFDRELPRLKHNPVIVGAALSPLIAAAATVVARHATGGFEAPLEIVFGLGGLVLLVGVRVTRPWPRSPLVRVQATRDRISLDGRALDRASLRGGFLLRANDGRTVVRIVPRWRESIDLVVTDEREARELLTALGLDALQTTATFRAAARPLAHPWLLFGGLAALWLITFAIASVFPIIVAMLVTLLSVLWSSAVDVGADGVLIRWASTRRFVRASEIVSTSRYVDSFGQGKIAGVALHLTGGRVVRIPLGSPMWAADRASMLVARIQHVMAASSATGAPTIGAALSRGDASPRAWIERLRALGAGDNASFRVAPIRQETLWQLVDDTRANPELRVAAALALAPSLDTLGRARIAEAARATVEPRIRIALDAAVSDDEDALEEALAKVSDERAAESLAARTPR